MCQLVVSQIGLARLMTGEDDDGAIAEGGAPTGSVRRMWKALKLCLEVALFSGCVSVWCVVLLVYCVFHQLHGHGYGRSSATPDTFTLPLHL